MRRPESPPITTTHHHHAVYSPLNVARQSQVQQQRAQISVRLFSHAYVKPRTHAAPDAIRGSHSN